MKFDPTRLEIFKNLYHSVAEEMGASLRRSAFSPNIKERRDYSCAVFDGKGNVLAMGDHMPVHLGSMPMSVAAAMAELDLGKGDLALLNDPYAGGTHLPDITMVMPIYVRGVRGPVFYVANRAHHADVGGSQAGSMGLAREIFQEGIRIVPVKLMQGGKIQRDILKLLLINVRTPEEREGDLTAQIASCRIGERRLMEIFTKYGRREIDEYARHLLDYSATMMRAALRTIPRGTYRAEDFLDGDGIVDRPIRIAASIRISGESAEVDFTGSDPQCAGSVNAVAAIAYSAVFYVFRCLLNEEVPATIGLMRPIRVISPEGTIVNARPPAAVAGGNVETSQRITDTLLRAMAQALPDKIPAASQGTMNNFTFGGIDPRRGGAPFAYYETIAGGMGARPDRDGISGIHTHMTNSWNSPIEVLEHSYPVRVLRYGFRAGSGGAGKYRGGDGLIREVELLTHMQVGLLCDRRKRGPYGLAGGKPGKPGHNELRVAGKRRELAAKCAFYAPAGSIVRIESPGGGGWGKRKKR
ncbi:MAG TPA: hydantoinase B/oxoprolinase family protein [Candidatus Limnocylindrales bacterium]|nr:hydantoinase B/oxoprolinase family protein [Candidatus Limnocylindrales bacterium]